MTKLYEVANDYAKLLDSDLDPALLVDTIEGLDGELTDKVEQLLAICKNESSYAKALKEESAALADRARVTENRVANIKTYIALSLETIGKKSMKAGIHQVTVRTPTKTVEISDAGLLPAEFVEYETNIKPDKLAIKHQLDAGIDVPGASLKAGKLSLIIK